MDLKGFGDSDKPPRRSSYKIGILVDELQQFIFTLGVKNCSIIGHDLGGLLGWYFVALHGDMVHKFVAIASPHPNIYWNGIPGETALGIKLVNIFIIYIKCKQQADLMFLILIISLLCHSY